MKSLVIRYESGERGRRKKWRESVRDEEGGGLRGGKGEEGRTGQKEGKEEEEEEEGLKGEEWRDGRRGTEEKQEGIERAGNEREESGYRREK